MRQRAELHERVSISQWIRAQLAFRLLRALLSDAWGDSRRFSSGPLCRKQSRFVARTDNAGYLPCVLHEPADTRSRSPRETTASKRKSTSTRVHIELVWEMTSAQTITSKWLTHGSMDHDHQPRNNGPQRGGRVDRNNGPHMLLFFAIHLGIGGNTTFYRLDVHAVDRNAPHMLLSSLIYLGNACNKHGSALPFHRHTF